MLSFLVRFAGTVAAVLLVVRLVPGVQIIGGWVTTLLVAFVWSLIVAVIRPVLRVLTLPITLITFGLFSLVLNAVLFYAMTWIVPGFTIDGVWAAVFGSLVLSLVTWLLDKALP